MFDVEKIREDFPILSREISGRPLIYLDNGATSQTPKCVVDHIADTYYRVNANVHRGVHTLSQEATDAHEAARRRATVHRGRFVFGNYFYKRNNGGNQFGGFFFWR